MISHTAHMHARWLTSYLVAMTGAPAVKIHEVYHRYYVNSKMFLYDLVMLLNLTSNFKNIFSCCKNNFNTT